MRSSLAGLGCALVLAVGLTSVALAQGGEENQISTLHSAPMPAATKLVVDDARAKINAAGIYADIEVEYTDVAAGNAAPFQVQDQDPSPGESVESGVGDLEPVLLTVYAPGIFPKTPCAEVVESLEDVLKGNVDYDLGNQILGKFGQLKPNFEFAQRPASFFRQAVAAGRAHTAAQGSPINLPFIDRIIPNPQRPCEPTVPVITPNDPSSRNLFISVQPRRRRPTFDQDWTLTAGTANYFTVQAYDRAHHVIQGAKIQLNATSVGGRDVTGVTSRTGKTSIKVTPRRAGIFVVQVSAIGGNGIGLFGTTQIKVTSKGSTFTTFLGDQFARQANGTYKFKFAKRPLQHPTSKIPACNAWLLIFEPTDASCPSRYLDDLGVLATNPGVITGNLGTVVGEIGKIIGFSPGSSNLIPIPDDSTVNGVLGQLGRNAGKVVDQFVGGVNPLIGLKPPTPTDITNLLTNVAGTSRATLERAGEGLSSVFGFLGGSRVSGGKVMCVIAPCPSTAELPMPPIGLSVPVVTPPAGGGQSYKPPVPPPAIIIPEIDLVNQVVGTLDSLGGGVISNVARTALGFLGF